uniref:Uncharacterized protein n=1 Tax=Compsopogon caeruleus TaxID=31354 RepID=A0A7S1XGW1_9RHOD|mmetsp:Transcript_8175/g.16493  ORF Transcript_8175/g.16493 Transcript_8175/m.16493 type:complete len:262 (+) Transcript_8175:60-845(+)
MERLSKRRIVIDEATGREVSGGVSIAGQVALRLAVIVFAVVVLIVGLVTMRQGGVMEGEQYTFEVSSPDNNVVKYVVKPHLSYLDALKMLSEDSSPGFRNLFMRTLEDSGFRAYFFETPPVTTANFDSQRFEFVLVDSPALAQVSAQPDAFRDHFHGRSVVQFSNLGGDALLVAPEDLLSGREVGTYAHLAAFMRNSQLRAQQSELWKQVAHLMIDRVSHSQSQPVWLSTSGLGIYWLHVRMDSTPKYYEFQPYRSWNPPR